MSRVRPAEQGLYRSEYEHDACGVAFVARLDAQPLHETVRRALEALANLEHRGAAGADASTGDGAGILMQIPDAFFRAVVAEEPARSRALRRRDVLPPARGASAGTSSSSCSTAIVEDEGQSVVCWRDVPVDPACAGRTAAAAAPLVRQLVVAAADAARRPGRVRAQALRDPPPLRARGRRRRDHPELLLADDRLQGDADGAAAPRLLPRPAGRAHRDRARARPLALLDEHVPELGARPPVPDDRAQRRDQHGAREHQLDAGARVAARVASCSATTSTRCCRSSGRVAPTRPCSTTCSSCSCSAAARCRTR